MFAKMPHLTAGNRGPVNFSSGCHLVLVLQVSRGAWSRGCEAFKHYTLMTSAAFQYSRCMLDDDRLVTGSGKCLAPSHGSGESAPTRVLMLSGLHAPTAPPARPSPHFLLKSEFNPSVPIPFSQMWDQEWEPDLRCSRQNDGPQRGPVSTCRVWG